MILIQTWRFVVLILTGFSISLGLFMSYSLKLPPTVIIIILIVALLWIITMHGSDRWRSETDKLRVRMINGQQPIHPKTYDSRKIVDLPEPVQRYFKTVLQDGQAIILPSQYRIRHWEGALMNRYAQEYLRFEMDSSKY